MTISEQLHFSILSAPIASADRRALSQAWYSALYRGTSKKPLVAADAKICRGDNTGAPPRAGVRLSAAPVSGAAPRAPRVEAYASRAAAGERRAPQLRLARQIEGLVRQRQSARTAATFVLDGSRARVRVLVVAGGGSIRLIAICSKNAREPVARALEQARYASAARGIILNATTREEVRC
jgi:hypothetical protein